MATRKLTLAFSRRLTLPRRDVGAPLRDVALQPQGATVARAIGTIAVSLAELKFRPTDGGVKGIDPDSTVSGTSTPAPRQL